jgi:hypothetical protein
VAAYLAAHGLAGAAVEAVGYVEGGPYPVSMTLESGDAVDDIRCGLRTCASRRMAVRNVSQ